MYHLSSSNLSCTPLDYLAFLFFKQCCGTCSTFCYKNAHALTRAFRLWFDCSPLSPGITVFSLVLVQVCLAVKVLPRTAMYMGMERQVPILTVLLLGPWFHWQPISIVAGPSSVPSNLGECCVPPFAFAYHWKCLAHRWALLEKLFEGWVVLCGFLSPSFFLWGRLVRGKLGVLHPLSPIGSVHHDRPSSKNIGPPASPFLP